MKKTKALLFVFAVVLCIIGSVSLAAVPNAYRISALKANVSPELAYAIALSRSGIRLDNGCREPWPWTLTLNNTVHHYLTRAEAHLALLKAVNDKVAHIKIGLLQLDKNMATGSAYELLDPYYNLMLGLQQLKADNIHLRTIESKLKPVYLKVARANFTGFCNKKVAQPRHINASFAKGMPKGVHKLRYQRNQAVQALVNNIASTFKLDPNLVFAVIQQESGFKVCAVSNKNAQGLMQLIPETQRRFGVRNPCDPADNIRGGVAYLHWLLRHFNGNVAMALAGYNAGENAVDKFRGIPHTVKPNNMSGASWRITQTISTQCHLHNKKHGHGQK